jgi:CRISPR-associated endonuclease/helicase Cas3
LAFGDIESTDLSERTEQGEHPRSVVIVGPPGPDGPASPRLIDRPADIRPGDVVVVPASYGGCDEFGWAPESREPVEDLGDLDLGRPRLRLAPQLPRPATLVAQAMELADSLAGDELSEDEVYVLVRDEVVASLREHPLRWLGSASSDAANLARADALRQVADGLAPTGRAVLYPAANARSEEGPAHGLVLAPDRPAVRRSTRRVTYADHTSAVEKRAEQFARSAGYDDRLRRTVCLAARYHDAGKLDPRFQAWLNDGVPADPSSPLAKSGQALNDARVASALKASGWPRNKRHEALSAALLDAAEPVRLANVDRDLALLLVATHHGRARPFYDEAPDERPVEIRVEIEGEVVSVASDTDIPWGQHAMRFVRLVEQYGAWGLASIEASLVLADRTVSAEEGEDR